VEENQGVTSMAQKSRDVTKGDRSKMDDFGSALIEANAAS